jgi:transposase InsO family protein
MQQMILVSNKTDYKYPYALKNTNLDRVNLAWCIDITYIKLPQSHIYLVAIADIYSQMILDYEISNTLDAEFCVRCLERYIKRYGAPAVLNTDQGVQHTRISLILCTCLLSDNNFRRLSYTDNYNSDSNLMIFSVLIFPLFLTQFFLCVTY